MYGTTQIPINTFNKVWILPDSAEVYEHQDTVLVVKSHLKVMLDEDYLALSKNTVIPQNTTVIPQNTTVIPQNTTVIPAKAGIQNAEVSSIGNQVIREIVLPAIEEEVNQGKNFAQLRQIYNSMILAVWFKNNLKQAFLNQVYTGRSKVNGVNVDDPSIKEKIYKQYLQAYKKGVFNYIKEEVDQNSHEMIPRKYFSGGLVPPAFAMMTPVGEQRAAQIFKGKKLLLVRGLTEDVAAPSLAMLSPQQQTVIKDIILPALKTFGQSMKTVMKPSAMMAEFYRSVQEKNPHRDYMEDSIVDQDKWYFHDIRLIFRNGLFTDHRSRSALDETQQASKLPSGVTYDLNDPAIVKEISDLITTLDGAMTADQMMMFGSISRALRNIYGKDLRTDLVEYSTYTGADEEFLPSHLHPMRDLVTQGYYYSYHSADGEQTLHGMNPQYITPDMHINSGEIVRQMIQELDQEAGKEPGKEASQAMLTQQVDRVIKSLGWEDVKINFGKLSEGRNIIVRSGKDYNQNDYVLLVNEDNRIQLKITRNDLVEEGAQIGKSLVSERVSTIRIGDYPYRTDKGPINLKNQWLGNDALLKFFDLSPESMSSFDSESDIQEGRLSNHQYRYNLINDAPSRVIDSPLVSAIPSAEAVAKARGYLENHSYYANAYQHDKLAFLHHLTVLSRIAVGKDDQGSYKEVVQDRLLATAKLREAAINETPGSIYAQMIEDIMWSSQILVINSKGYRPASLDAKLESQFNTKNPFTIEKPEDFEVLVKSFEALVKAGKMTPYIIINIKNFSPNTYMAYLSSLEEKSR